MMNPLSLEREARVRQRERFAALQREARADHLLAAQRRNAVRNLLAACAALLMRAGHALQAYAAGAPAERLHTRIND
jgi:hypothetical protein